MEIFSLLQETDALGKTYKALSQRSVCLSYISLIYRSYISNMHIQRVCVSVCVSEQRTTEKVEYLEKYVGISRIKGHHGNLQDAYMSLGAFYCSQVDCLSVTFCLVCLSVCLSICLSVSLCLSVCQPVCLPVCVSVGSVQL